MGNEIKIPEDVSRNAMDFAKRLFGSVADALEFLGDKIRFYRWQSSLKTLERAAEIAKEKGINPKDVPLKFLVPFLEKSSLEAEESSLTEEWANLLVRASESYQSLHLAYAQVLSQITANEANLLKELVGKTPIKSVGEYFEKEEREFFQKLAENDLGDLLDSFSGKDGCDNEGRNLASMIIFPAETQKEGQEISPINMEEQEHIYILERLNLIRTYSVDLRLPIKSKKIKKENEWGPIRRVILRWYRITTFGYDFVMTCEGKETLYKKREKQLTEAKKRTENF